MCVTYICFYQALKAQGVDRSSLPYTGWFQPYSAWIGLVFMTLIVFCYGYATFLPGEVRPHAHVSRKRPTLTACTVGHYQLFLLLHYVGACASAVPWLEAGQEDQRRPALDR